MLTLKEISKKKFIKENKKENKNKIYFKYFKLLSHLFQIDKNINYLKKK